MALSNMDRRRWVAAALVALAAMGGGCRADEPTSPEQARHGDDARVDQGHADVTTGATSTSSSSAGTPSTTSSGDLRRQTASALGFGEVAFTITPARGASATAAEFCALLAESERQRARGLMGRRDLAGYDGMLFRFDADTTAAFYMRNVPVALSIAWFTADGRFVSSTDMAPCPDQEGCPTYAPARPYRLALEVLQGGLDRLGVAEGSVLTVGGACSR